MNALEQDTKPIISSTGECILSEASLVDCLNKDHPLIVNYVKELTDKIEILHKENQAYIETLKRINSCDDSATQHSREAHRVLKQFGKL